jgi:hypothetical protein
MKLFSIALVLSAVCTGGVSALPKPKSRTATVIDVSQIRIANSSMEKARFGSLTFNSKNNASKDEKKKKSLENNGMISFAREHANLAPYLVIAYAVGMAVKCECPIHIQSSFRLSILSILSMLSIHPSIHPSMIRRLWYFYILLPRSR